MFGTQFWFFNLVAFIIIVEDLHHSYILNKKKEEVYFLILLYFFLSPQIPQTQLNFYTYPPPSLLPVPTNPTPYSFPLKPQPISKSSIDNKSKKTYFSVVAQILHTLSLSHMSFGSGKILWLRQNLRWWGHGDGWI